MQEPKSFFISSACLRDIPHPLQISSVTELPPNGITEEYLIILSVIIVSSVVPAPISTSAAPISFSSIVNAEYADAIGAKIKSCNLIPVLCMTFFKDCAELFLPISKL